MKSYHATYSININSIIEDGFSTKKEYDWPGDLGNGVYSYIDPDENGLFDYSAKDLAYLFVANGKSQSINKTISVLELNLKPNMTLLDLTDPKIKMDLQKLKVRIKERYLNKKILDGYIESGAKHRGHTDGLFFEYLFKHFDDYKLNPDGVMNDTVARIDRDYYLSNFPNGRELCIRHTDVIFNIKVVS